MSDEEKKAIEYLNKYSIITRFNETPTSNSIQIVLNLIDKQQKQLEDKKKHSKKQQKNKYKYVIDLCSN